MWVRHRAQAVPTLDIMQQERGVDNSETISNDGVVCEILSKHGHLPLKCATTAWASALPV